MNEGCHPGLPTEEDLEISLQNFSNQQPSTKIIRKSPIGDIIERNPPEASSIKPPGPPRKPPIKVLKQQKTIEKFDEDEMKSEIDEENKKIVEAMSLEEIEEEQTFLKRTLPPKVLQRWMMMSKKEEGG